MKDLLGWMFEIVEGGIADRIIDALIKAGLVAETNEDWSEA